MDLLTIATEIPQLCKSILARNDQRSRDRLAELLGAFSLLQRKARLPGLPPGLDVRAPAVAGVGAWWAEENCDRAKQVLAAERIGDFFERLRMHIEEHPLPPLPKEKTNER